MKQEKKEQAQTGWSISRHWCFEYQAVLFSAKLIDAGKFQEADACDRLFFTSFAVKKK